MNARVPVATRDPLPAAGIIADRIREARRAQLRVGREADTLFLGYTERARLRNEVPNAFRWTTHNGREFFDGLEVVIVDRHSYFAVAQVRT